MSGFNFGVCNFRGLHFRVNRGGGLIFNVSFFILGFRGFEFLIPSSSAKSAGKSFVLLLPVRTHLFFKAHTLFAKSKARSHK